MPKDADPRECSIADALQVIGERWSLLVIRELVYGVRRFDAIARNTGAPRDILTTRLRKLETAGIVRRELYSERPARYEYHLTESGWELSDVLAVLMSWGDRHLNPDDPPVRWTHVCGERLRPQVVCACCGRPVRDGATPTGRGART
ncbi:HxlR family transcriptional regulator [Actinomadura sp. NBRC 104425]|uniref:winged helix-turn-helix transcriptional regulator n=1 Tax=Actinomadura sp. NBRC 104425 TaxID=3032204 RepID=UPI0024A08129|nr:helix-turn-helix domain-containing protein [Actinomadura sp. NBRC 104425]GLZ13097.1 HxlR family transcriptional regulator [Actinomadura sp. NBRC 104425]